MNIYESICGVMGDVGAISKQKKNEQGKGFMYRGIDDVMNALQPILVKHKVFIVPTILEQVREERASRSGGTLIYSVCKIEYTFFAEDGTSIKSIVVGEGMDSGDKATNKAMSVAYKYACFQVFCIPTEEMKDPDSEVHSVAPKDVTRKSRDVTPQDEEAKDKEESNKVKRQLIDKVKIATLQAVMTQKGVPIKEISRIYGVDELGLLTIEQFGEAMSLLSPMEDRKPKKKVEGL